MQIKESLDSSSVQNYFSERLIEMKTPIGMPAFKGLKPFYEYFVQYKKIAKVEYITCKGYEYQQAFLVLQEPGSHDLLKAIPDAYGHRSRSGNICNIVVRNKWSVELRIPTVDRMKKLLRVMHGILEWEIKKAERCCRPRAFIEKFPNVEDSQKLVIEDDPGLDYKPYASKMFVKELQGLKDDDEE